MLIGELSERSGVSTRSLRHYDRSALLRSSRASNGYREFPSDAVEQVRRIRSLLALGFAVAEVRVLQPCFTDAGELEGCDLAVHLLEAQRARMDNEIEDRRLLLDQISRRIETLS